MEECRPGTLSSVLVSLRLRNMLPFWLTVKSYTFANLCILCNGFVHVLEKKNRSAWVAAAGRSQDFLAALIEALSLSC
eukprot:145315-Pelagomonas_calceolata.AAC.2